MSEGWLKNNVASLNLFPRLSARASRLIWGGHAFFFFLTHLTNPRARLRRESRIKAIPTRIMLLLCTFISPSLEK